VGRILYSKIQDCNRAQLLICAGRFIMISDHHPHEAGQLPMTHVWIEPAEYDGPQLKKKIGAML